VNVASRVFVSLMAAATLLTVSVSLAQAQVPPPARSFLELQRTLTTGEQVTVLDRQNRRATGRVVSVSGDRIEIMSSRSTILGRSSRGRSFAFAEGDVRWIVREDSTWNGRLIGTGLGIVAAGMIVARTDSQRAALSALIFLPPIGGAAGHAIDARNRRALYLSPNAAFAIRPSFGSRAAGIAATVTF
jgi:hypothetical protein